MTNYIKGTYIFPKGLRITELDFSLMSYIIECAKDFSTLREISLQSKYEKPDLWMKAKCGWGKEIFFTSEYLAKQMSESLQTSITKEEIRKSLHKWQEYLGKDFWSKPSKEEKNGVYYDFQIRARHAKEGNFVAYPNIFRNIPTRSELKKIIMDKVLDFVNSDDYADYWKIVKQVKEKSKQPKSYTKEDYFMYERFMQKRKENGINRYMNITAFVNERNKRIEESKVKKERDQKRRQVFKTYLLQVIYDRVEKLDQILAIAFNKCIGFGEITDFGIGCVQIMKKLKDKELLFFIKNELLNENLMLCK